jgi:uncharacterized membrane protein
MTCARRGVPWLAGAALGLPLLLASVLLPGSDVPSRLHLFVGRLHPLVVHLPIGFLILAALLEGLSRTRSLRRLGPAVPVALVLGSAGAMLAVLAGTLLAGGGAYDGPTVSWHRLLGIGVAAGAVLTTALWYAGRVHRRAWVRGAYSASLLLTLSLLLAAGHLGGTLTRGPDYLTEHMPEPMLAALHMLPGRATTVAPAVHRDEVRIYEHMVRPVLQARCVSCHGPDKRSGGLRLDTPDGIREGGDSGPAVVAGSIGDSELLRRIWLPEAHEEHMPPRGRKPVTVAEAELLRWWVEGGAGFESTVAQASPPRVVLDLLEQIAGPMDVRRPQVLRASVAHAEQGALRRAAEAGLAVRPIAEGSSLLEVRCGDLAACGPAQVQALQPLAEQITVLDLRGATISDEDLALLGALPNLTRLRLDRTGTTDAGLAHLGGLRHLDYLNLHGTGVSDAGLDALSGLDNLRFVHLWDTGVTPAGAHRLRELLPRARVDLGLSEADRDSLERTFARDSAAAVTAY